MAVRIPIVTVFDSKGLKQAQYALNKVRGNFQNLGRNFAVAGAGIGAFGVALGKSVGQASNLAESVNAVNVAFGKSAQGILDFGKTASTTLGVSAVDFNNAAVRFSAFADRIVGAGNDSSKFIAEISTRASDFASVFNIDVAEALGVFQSGLAGEAEPLKRFGINLLDSEVKAYAAANGIGELGRNLTETEKVQARYGLLMEATNKVAGDFANTSGGLANATRILQSQFTDLQAEIGQALLPAIEEIIPVFQDLILEFGPKLKQALAEVDWAGLVKGLADAVIFLVQNAETIMKVVTAMFLLNTAYNLGRVAVGLYDAATVILNGTMKTATGLAGGLRTALFLGGVTLAVGYVIDSYRKLKTAIQNTNTSLSAFDTEVLSVTKAAGEINPIVKLWNNLTSAILNALTAKKRFDGGGATPKPTIGTGFGGADVNSWKAALPPAMDDPFADIFTPGTTGGAGTKKKTPLADLLKQLRIDGKKVQLEAKLIGAGISEALAKQLSSTLPVKQIEAILKKIVDTGGKYAKKLQKLWGATQQGIAQMAGGTGTTDAAVLAQEQNKNIVDSIKELIGLFKAPKKELGAFQQAVVDTFQSINEAIRARDFGSRKETRYLGISAFVQQQLEAIAKQRDEIASRIEKSKSFMSSVVDSIIGPTDITRLGKTSTAIIGSLKKTITQTLNFRKQISDLSGMGLGANAIQQIVQAGALEGGQTASALLAGGPEAINEVNSLYAQLGSTAETFAETAGQAVYGAGVDISNGLIAGLLSQDAALRQAATTLGNSFSDYFKRRLGISLRPETMDIAAVGTTRAGTTINLTVTAPYNSRPQDFGRLIVEAISDFERRSGQVFARA